MVASDSQIAIITLSLISFFEAGDLSIGSMSGMTRVQFLSIGEHWIVGEIIELATLKSPSEPLNQIRVRPIDSTTMTARIDLVV